jgi:metal-responsive CopG/Arc/MetJ family transcriptional regulator
MKVKTSVSLSEECLRELDALAGKDSNRSALIESAVVEYIARRRRKSRGLEDQQRIAANAKSLERDVLETLEFQAPE